MKALSLLVLSLAVLPARAIELSLEENKAQRGSVGVVDIQRIFRTSPETQRAKEAFEELIRQAEEQLSVKKAERLRMRHDLADLKAQRELLARTPLLVSTAPAAAAAAPVKASTVPAALLLPGLSESTETLKGPGLQLPGATTAQTAIAPPSGPPAPAAAAPAPSAALTELDARIALKASELAAKDAEFKAAQAATEQNLLDIESRKTEIILGRIHKAVQETARAEGISVIVDKSSVLYGHDAVDLTDKVLKRLKGAQP